MTSGNEIVDKVTKMNITGNTIPHNWYKTITRPNGKPYLNAIVILSDIVYWYRATEVRDENTNYVIGMKKKFSDPDFLQRDYGQLSKFFGMSKEETRNAMEHLEKIGVIKKHLRTIQNNGRKIPNVLYIELIPEKLYELTYFGSGGMGLKTDMYRFENTGGMGLKTDTNTKNTTENTTENTTKKKRGKRNPLQPSQIHIDIINYLNEKANKRFSPYTENTIKIINSRLNENRTLEDFKYVIDVKVNHWLGTDFANNLCPDTLFACKNFEKYLNQVPKSQKGAAYGQKNNTFIDNSSTGGVQAPTY